MASKMAKPEWKHFLAIMKDFKDAGALERRLAIREKHLNRAKGLQQQGQVVLAGAMLDSHASGKMTGSAMVFQAESEDAVRDLINSDPYIEGKVWDDIEIIPLKIALGLKD